MTRDRAAFFDVDDTLITIKSMFRFLQYDIAASDRPPSEYTRAMARLRELKATSLSVNPTLPWNLSAPGLVTISIMLQNPSLSAENRF